MKYHRRFLKLLLIPLALFIIYLLTLLYPQPFFKYKVTRGNITVYSDEEIPSEETSSILEEVQTKIQKSELYNKETKHRIFIANNDIRWRYFSNIYRNVGGINSVFLNHNIFLRHANLNQNSLYGPSGTKVQGDRTLSYFMAHEIAHTLEYQSMPRYKYFFQPAWLIEGYAEYIAYGSQSYESALDKYLNTPETSAEKYYTRIRVLVTYLLDEEGTKASELWNTEDPYETILDKAIPNDNPNIDEDVYR